MESFAGVANPFSLRPLAAGEHVVDVGAGAGFDSFVAARQIGPSGRVIGVDMTEEMLVKVAIHRCRARDLTCRVSQRAGGSLPVEDGWADVVISNGVINLCADKRAVFAEIHRVLRRGAVCNSRTSRTGSQCRRRRSTTSISGQLELPVVCRVQPGSKCWKKSDLWM